MYAASVKASDQISNSQKIHQHKGNRMHSSPSRADTNRSASPSFVQVMPTNLSLLAMRKRSSSNLSKSHSNRTTSSGNNSNQSSSAKKSERGASGFFARPTPSPVNTSPYFSERITDEQQVHSSRSKIASKKRDKRVDANQSRQSPHYGSGAGFDSASPSHFTSPHEASAENNRKSQSQTIHSNLSPIQKLKRERKGKQKSFKKSRSSLSPTSLTSITEEQMLREYSNSTKDHDSHAGGNQSDDTARFVNNGASSSKVNDLSKESKSMRSTPDRNNGSNFHSYGNGHHSSNGPAQQIRRLRSNSNLEPQHLQRPKSFVSYGEGRPLHWSADNDKNQDDQLRRVRSNPDDERPDDEKSQSSWWRSSIATEDPVRHIRRAKSAMNYVNSYLTQQNATESITSVQNENSKDNLQHPHYLEGISKNGSGALNLNLKNLPKFASEGTSPGTELASKAGALYSGSFASTETEYTEETAWTYGNASLMTEDTAFASEATAFTSKASQGIHLQHGIPNMFTSDKGNMIRGRTPIVRQHEATMRRFNQANNAFSDYQKERIPIQHQRSIPNARRAPMTMARDAGKQLHPDLRQSRPSPMRVRSIKTNKEMEKESRMDEVYENRR